MYKYGNRVTYEIYKHGNGVIYETYTHGNGVIYKIYWHGNAQKKFLTENFIFRAMQSKFARFPLRERLTVASGQKKSMF